MRFYGPKIIRGMVGRTVAAKTETRDAILWDVLPDQRVCRVKIQGSAELIVANYPENWEKTPWWLKPGNAVRITHPGGERGRIEIFGPGAAVPTPVAGSGSPPIATPPDGILSGCHVTECYNNPRMAVLVLKGVFRIGGNTYYLNEIAMNSDVFKMGDGGAMDAVAGAVAINSAPSSGLWRYDLISIGTDSVIDYTAGTAVPAAPVKPNPASGHIELANILVGGGDTAIKGDQINKVWSAPIPSYLKISPEFPEMQWSESFISIFLNVYDQYDKPYSVSGVMYFSLEILSGNGWLFSYSLGESSQTKVSGFGSGGAQFSYRRGQTSGDLSPRLRGTLYLEKDLIAETMIILLDSEGKPMLPGE